VGLCRTVTGMGLCGQMKNYLSLAVVLAAGARAWRYRHTMDIHVAT